ncbi:uncharacterized protein LOC130672313 [Microplitis mediator]|uniref:uncharacterized protein LOC130672313 n=1 Tax=Microplitis mediator TaxID=375433 RepID=UPI002554B16B|nr:uncharacterized protein LOC130672313 [Microplitis mediator]
MSKLKSGKGVLTRSQNTGDELLNLESPDPTGGSKLIHTPPGNTSGFRTPTEQTGNDTIYKTPIDSSSKVSLPKVPPLNIQDPSLENNAQTQSWFNAGASNASTPGLAPVLARVDARIDNLTAQLRTQGEMSNVHVDAINRLTDAVNQLFLRETTCNKHSQNSNEQAEQSQTVSVVRTVDPSGLSLGGGETVHAALDNIPALVNSTLPSNTNHVDSRINPPVNSNSLARTNERRWKDILDHLKMWPLRFPSQDSSANEFISTAEAHATREGWSDDELLRVMGYLLQDRAAKWFDVNFTRWNSYRQFKLEFVRTFGSTKTDHQILVELGQMRPNTGEKMSEFAFRMQAKYQTMNIPPSENEQVSCIRNHLNSEVRNLVFARHVDNYEDLLAAIHEATQTLEEGSRVFGKDKTVEEPKIFKNREKSRFSALQSLRGTEFYLESDRGRQPLVIEEIKEGKGGEHIICASAGVSTVTSGQYGQRSDQYRPRYNTQFQGQQSTQPQYPQTHRSYPPRTQNYPGRQGFINNNSNQFSQRNQTNPSQSNNNYIPWLPNAPRNNRPCYNCGESGHTFDTCTNPRRDVCNYCNMVGHTRQTCRRLQQPPNQRALPAPNTEQNKTDRVDRKNE